MNPPMTKRVLQAIAVAGAFLCGAHLAMGKATADPGQPTSTDSTAILIPLEYREVGFEIDSEWIKLRIATEAETAKLNTPQVAKDIKLTFGTLEIGTNRFGFAWDRNAARLYLDLNQNLDFTDDPGGVFDAAEKGYYQKFNDIRLSVSDGPGQYDYLVDLRLYSTRSAFAELRSFYEGKIELAGQTWQIGLVKRLAAKPGSTPSRPAAALLMRPWAERTKEFSLTDSAAITVPLCEIVYLWDRSYTPQIEWQQCDNTNKPVLKLRPAKTELGQLELAGLYVQRLVLKNAPQRAALFHSPDRIIQVPVGTYNNIEVFLKNGDAEATAELVEKVVVTTNTTNLLAVGGPLTNSVTVTVDGRVLRMSYKLVGYGGKEYNFNYAGARKPPEFNIYKGDKRISSGRFRFG